MKRYVVTTTILSRQPGATPADVTYYRGEDQVQALAALLQAATTYNNMDDSGLPESMKFDVTGVRMDIFEVEEEPEPSFEEVEVQFAHGVETMYEEVDASPSITGWANGRPLYSLAAIKHGTGFRTDTRFVEIGPEDEA